MKNLLLLLIFIGFYHAAPAQKSQDSPIVKSMLVFPEQPQHTHSSCLVNLPNGDLLITWFQGNGERQSNDVKIMGARLKNHASSWSPPLLMADSYNLPDCNPVLFLNNQKKLFLVWVAVIANEWQNGLLKYKTSVNYNNSAPPEWTWGDNIILTPDNGFEKELQSKFKDLPPLTTGWSAYAPEYDKMILLAAKDPEKRTKGWMTRIAPLILKNGNILLPLYSDGYNLSIIAISDDDGLTWRPSLPLAGRGNVQPSLIQKNNGIIVAYMRDNGDEPTRVQVSESADNGQTWTAAKKTNIPNTASVKLCRLKDGRWALIVNDQEDGRYRLSLYISQDEGETWPYKYALENVAKGKGSFSYPSMLQGADGLLHISYSYQQVAGQEAIKYVVVDPAKIHK